MSWSVNIAPTLRDDLDAVLDEYRSSRGGIVPDDLIRLIAEQVDDLEPNWTKASIVTSGHVGSGSPRKFSVTVTGHP